MLEDDDLPALGRKLQDRYTLALVRPVSGCDCYDQTGECYLELGEHMGEQRGASGTRLLVVY